MDNYELNPITGNLDIVGVSSEKLKQILATLTEPLVFAGTVIVLDNGGQEANTIAVHSVNNELTFTSDIIPDETLLSAVKCDPGWVWVVVTGGLSHELGQLNVGDNILIVSPSDFYGLHAEVLTDIVPIGYQFIGVADPTTNDNDIDVNVKCAWFAATAGTYTGLGNVVVDDNEIAVITRVSSGGVASYTKTSLGKYVKTSDIVDDLDTDAAHKVLSAKQGKKLAEKIGPVEITDIVDKKYVILSTGVGEHIGAVSDSNTWSYIRTSVSEGDTVIVNGTGGTNPRLWAFIDDQEIILSVADANVSGVNLTLVAPSNAAEVIINTLDVSVPSYYIKKGALQNQIGDITKLKTTNKNNLVDAINEVNNGITGIGENVTLLNEEVTNLANKVDNVVVATNLITWTDQRFIKSPAEIVTTSSTNKVGSIDVAGRNIVNFNFSVKRGGSYSKWGWFISSAAGSVLLNSSEYASTADIGATDVEVKLPEGAKTLYVSWNPDLSNFQFLKFKESIQELYGLVGNIEDRVNGLETRVNIENLEVRAFDAIRYNDADYSYTRCPYPDNISYKRNLDFSYPNAISIDTPVDVNATTRHLEFANNKAFTNGRVISLDLVSPKYMLTNLEGDKIYYWRVYKDSTVTAILSSGWFKTDGHIRDLLIKANSNFEYEYIMNVRDIGGWKTSNGKRLRYGCIIRGHELNHVEDNVTTSYISQDGIDELKALGVSAELDLRGVDTTESALGNDVAYESIAVDLFFYRLNIYNNPVVKLNQFKSCLQQIITWLSEGKGIYIHCAGGCDRTGFLIALIEGICGVSENDINHDYELSGRDRSREFYTIAGGSDYDGDFKFAIEYIKGLLEYNGNIYVYYRGNYYDPTATITSFTPVPISDPTLIEALNALPFGTFKQCWRRLMKIGGVNMSERDMDRLEQLLCS